MNRTIKSNLFRYVVSKSQKNGMKKFYFFISIVGYLLLTNSCSKQEVEVPSYVEIKEISVFTDYSKQGSNSSKITDAWIDVDGKNLGAYELPCKFPVIGNGKKTIIVNPGIKFNGLSSARKINTFYKPYSVEVELTPAQTTLIKPSVTYADFVKFAWKEDFESAGVSIVEESSSNSAFVTDNSSTKVFEGIRCGKFITSSDKPFFESRSSESFVLPTLGSNIMIEFNYSCSTNFYFGIVAFGAGGYFESYPVYTFNTSTTNPEQPNWRKIYINLTEPIGSFNTKANKFKMYFQAGSGNGDPSGEILLDNVKLMYY